MLTFKQTSKNEDSIKKKNEKCTKFHIEFLHKTHVKLPEVILSQNFRSGSSGFFLLIKVTFL